MFHFHILSILVFLVVIEMEHWAETEAWHFFYIKFCKPNLIKISIEIFLHSYN